MCPQSALKSINVSCRNSIMGITQLVGRPGLLTILILFSGIKCAICKFCTSVEFRVKHVSKEISGMNLTSHGLPAVCGSPNFMHKIVPAACSREINTDKHNLNRIFLYGVTKHRTARTECTNTPYRVVVRGVHVKMPCTGCG